MYERVNQRKDTGQVRGMRTFNVDRSPAASNSVGVGIVKDQARSGAGGLRRDELCTFSRSAIRVGEIRH